MNDVFIMVVVDGTVDAFEYKTVEAAVRAYRATVVNITRKYGEAKIRGNKRERPHSMWVRYQETAFVAVYAPNWTEMMVTRIEPWEC